MSRALIFANGILPDPKSATSFYKVGDLVIAADGGLRNALSSGLLPQVLIGDMDSLSQKEVEQADKKGIEIIRFPAEKNETDLELAIDHAVRKGCTTIIVVGALGARLDQTLGNISLLDRVPAHVQIRLDDGHEEVLLAHGPVAISGKVGDVVSLIPWGNDVKEITTKGLRYPLNDETLYPFQTRGISNEMTGHDAAIDFKSGLLVVIHTRTLSES